MTSSRNEIRRKTLVISAAAGVVIHFVTAGDSAFVVPEHLRSVIENIMSLAMIGVLFAASVDLLLLLVSNSENEFEWFKEGSPAPKMILGTYALMSALVIVAGVSAWFFGAAMPIALFVMISTLAVALKCIIIANVLVTFMEIGYALG